VVQLRPYALRAQRQKIGFGRRDGCGDLLYEFFKMFAGLLRRMRLKQDVLASELMLRVFANVAFWLDAELVNEVLRRRRPQRALDFGLLPDIEGAFALFLGLGRIDHAVGVLGGVESALRIEHV